jgi:hypothetical protein
MFSTLQFLSVALALLLIASPAPAQVVIYLDFDHHEDLAYPLGSSMLAISVPAFTGNAAARASIQAAIEEDYAPFNVTVTQVEPAGINRGYNGQIRVAIGGSTTDLGGGREGLSTSPLLRNTVWAAEFTSNGTRRSDHAIANTASHELAHAFGALAASLPYGTLGNQLEHYHAGPNSSNPLADLEHNLSSQGKTQILNGPPVGGPVKRDIWWRHHRVAKALTAGGDPMDPADWLWAWQDDVVSLAAALGLRADDHGDTPETGSAMAAYTGSLPAGQTRVVASGVVEMNGMSWPGLCPPVPLWRSCPPYPPEDDGYPPVGTDDLGQNVVFAIARDFFRFNVGATTSPSGPRLEIRVDVIAGQFDANLDADLEVWYLHPSSGWTNVTSNGGRQDLPTDLWAQWNAAGTTAIPQGEYAVAVKSHGGYGDLGGYTVQVTGKDVVVRAAGTDFVVVPPAGPGPGLDLDGATTLAIVLESLLLDTDDLVLLLARLADDGLSEGRLWRYLEQGLSPKVSKTSAELVTLALRQASALRVVTGLVNWKTINPKAGIPLHARLAKALTRVEAR